MMNSLTSAAGAAGLLLPRPGAHLRAFVRQRRAIGRRRPGFGSASGTEGGHRRRWATALRLPFGLCALAAGWLADHFGAKRLLLVYLVGCSAAALLGLVVVPSLAGMFVAMFLLGIVRQHLPPGRRGADHAPHHAREPPHGAGLPRHPRLGRHRGRAVPGRGRAGHGGLVAGRTTWC